MSVHEAVDVGTIALSGVLLRGAKFFSRRLEYCFASFPYQEINSYDS